ncbi:MAG: hypothetical protein V5804_17565 [Mucilaginibacter sp.]|uniref:hypothetical protein n=1 Tax=Mucilaginibacter sp. TaxID=1882438 RepID=UPI0034E394EF
MALKRVCYFVVFQLIFVLNVQAQTEQKKAEGLVEQYLLNKTKNTSNHTSIKFNPIKALRSAFESTTLYKNLLHKVDSLKIEGKRIDARIAKMKTTAELNQAKKDSYRLSKELSVASDHLIDFISTYKGQQTGWILKTRYPIKTKRGTYSSIQKTFYLNKDLTLIDSAK